jgi:hypothetical protein
MIEVGSACVTESNAQQYCRAFFREFQVKPIAPKGTGGDAKILLRCMPLGLSPAYM